MLTPVQGDKGEVSAEFHRVLKGEMLELFSGDHMSWSNELRVRFPCGEGGWERGGRERSGERACGREG